MNDFDFIVFTPKQLKPYLRTFYIYHVYELSMKTISDNSIIHTILMISSIIFFHEKKKNITNLLCVKNENGKKIFEFIFFNSQFKFISMTFDDYVRGLIV